MRRPEQQQQRRRGVERRAHGGVGPHRAARVLPVPHNHLGERGVGRGGEQHRKGAALPPPPPAATSACARAIGQRPADGRPLVRLRRLRRRTDSLAQTQQALPRVQALMTV